MFIMVDGKPFTPYCEDDLVHIDAQIKFYELLLDDKDFEHQVDEVKIRLKELTAYLIHLYSCRSIAPNQLPILKQRREMVLREIESAKIVKADCRRRRVRGETSGETRLTALQRIALEVLASQASNIDAQTLEALKASILKSA